MMSTGARAEDSMVLSGTLQGGMMGIGGEHSGFVLDDASIELDLSEVENAADLAGQKVKLQGHFDIKQYVERGPTPVFRVTAAKAASDPAPFPAAKPAGAVAGVRSREEMRAEALNLLENDEAFREEVRQKLLKTEGPAPQ
jgi:hypothetical protein